MLKTAVITGASRGIGKAIAEELASRGYHLALISQHYAEVKKVAAELSIKYPGTYLPFESDVGNKNRIIKTFEEINAQFGVIEAIINNAGINSRQALNPKDYEKWFDNLSPAFEGWTKELQTNLTGTFLCSYLAAGYMLKHGSGSIINISSIKGIETTTSPGYGSSKAGIIKLTKDMAKVLAPFGIRVNCIAPGFINTGMTTELPEEKKESCRKLIPQGRFGTVEEVAKVAAFLASSDAGYITGTTINVSGGYLM
jgi:3-oxoacyl-[acyl-carrier protein] reductase